MSQDFLARACDLKLSNLAKLEGGFNSNPTLVTMISLAKVLSDGSLDGLLENKEKSNKKVALSDISRLGSRIKSLRQEQGISQEELVRQAGLKLSNLAKLEGRFNSNPTLATLQSLAGVLSQGSIDHLLVE